jgi:hypothetical protein
MMEVTLMKRFFSPQVAVGVLVLTLAALFPKAGNAAVTGLVKASTPAVYYATAAGERYAFPNEKTFFSWFPSFAQVQTISDQELAGLRLRANVTYRPGMRLVKVATDPKVYAVAHGGVLRWVQSEGIAAGLFGYDWARQVDDIPDAFFVNYTVGAPIENAGQFNPLNERAVALSIEADRDLPPPTNPPTLSTPSIPPVQPPPTIPPVSTYPGTLRTIRVSTASAIRQAMNEARPGDLIRIAPGSYTLTQQFWIDKKGTATNPIYLIADGARGSVKFTSTGDESFNVGGGASYLVFEGFEVVRARNDVFHIQDGAHHITLRNLNLHDAGPDGDVVKINQAHHITIEGCDLARPGRRTDGSEAFWQEALDLVDVDDAIIRRNFIHDVGNMAGYVKGGSKRALIEENVIDNQRGGADGNPIWGIGGSTDEELLQGEQYEAIDTVFRNNVIAHGAYGGLALFDAKNSLIEHNLFLNNASVLVQSRAGNGPRASTDGVILKNNLFVDTTGRMPLVCEKLNHGLTGVIASGNTYWNNDFAIPSDRGCGFMPSQEAGAGIRNPGIRDSRPTTYEQAMELLRF